jgi:glycosyltransferase involved in cell wall biosynthesis
VPPEETTAARRRITLVAVEILGYVRTGGLGTATSHLAVALARRGHDVEVLYVGPPPTAPIEPEWAALYEQAGVAVRLLPRTGVAVEPSYFQQLRDTELALRETPPDVVIAQDLAAPAYSALRLRQLGLAFDNTTFVVYCHGTRQWITDVSGKARVLPGALAISVLERASVELADAVVSPSAYLLDWMRRETWQLPPETVVIPYLTRSVATGEPPARAQTGNGRVQRISFFGRLEERKGLRPFAAALNALDRKLLEGVDLDFVGRSTPAWPPERVRALLTDDTRAVLREISFATDLDQQDALARLSRPGTLAVMPSLEDNSPNAVYECLERAIPFRASHAGGTAELIAEEDRRRVTFEPTAAGVEQALAHALTNGDALRPARASFDGEAAVDRWLELVSRQPARKPRPEQRPHLQVVVTQGTARDGGRCRRALAQQTYPNFEPLFVSHRADGLRAAQSDWIVFLEHDDLPHAEFLETLVRAQTATDADVVTCGIAFVADSERREHLFLGEPGGLGLVANHYGTAALIRRALLHDAPPSSGGAGDDDWPLLARLSLDGARIVSIPAVLIERSRRPGTLAGAGPEGLLVVRQFERNLPAPHRSLARLAAGLAVDAQTAAGGVSLPRRLLRRIARR